MGKGDTFRPVNPKRWSENYERIFGKNHKPVRGHFIFGHKDSKRMDVFYVPDLTERFNRGLGCYTCGTRDAEKKAKAKGLVPIGDQKLDIEKFKAQRQSEFQKEVNKLINEGMKAMKVGRTLEGVPLEKVLRRS